MKRTLNKPESIIYNALKKPGTQMAEPAFPTEEQNLTCIFCGREYIDFTLDGKAFHMECLRHGPPRFRQVEISKNGEGVTVYCKVCGKQQDGSLGGLIDILREHKDCWAPLPTLHR